MNAQFSSNWDDLLAGACDTFHWDRLAQAWKTSDGKWYSLSPVNLQALQQTIETLKEISTLSVDRQWIIADKALDFMMNILSCPSPNPNDRQITRLTWHLMFNLVRGNSENQIKLWNECGEFFLDFLRQDVYNNDTCRMIVYNIYVLGGVGANEGTTILKILLNSFHFEKQAVPLKQQELTIFLEHFITDVENINSMYLTLNDIEKLALLQFVIDYVSEGIVVGSRISTDLLFTICNDFIAKSETLFQSSNKDETQICELFALFDCIAHISNSKDYALNTFNFKLVRNVAQLTSLVILNEDDAERVFSAIRRNSSVPLKHIILSTISNLVRDNGDHKEQARDDGIIDNLVDLMAAKGHDKMTYRCTIFALTDICQTSPINMEYVEKIVKHRGLVNSPVFAHFAYDLTYKGTR